MFISVNDMETISKMMETEMNAGNKWLTYQSGAFITGRGDLRFFKTEEEAEDYSISNYSDYDQFTGREIKPLYSALRERITNDRNRDDIEYYFANGNNEINSTLKVNPDQNPLYNTEGNAFTDSVIDQWDELSHLRSTINNQDHLTYLQNLVKHLGFGDDLKSELEKNILESKSHFQVPVDTFFDEDKVQYILHFQNKENGTYSLDKYDAILQKAIQVDDITVNGVNTKELESRMETVDWNNDFGGKTNTKQLEFVQNIVTDLSKLDVRNKNYLKAKFWTDKPFGQHPLEKEIFELIKRSNQYKQSVTVRGYDSINAKQCHELLKQRSELMEEILNKVVPKANFSSLKNNTMNQDNLNYLKNNLKFTGFGEALNAELEKNISNGVPEFTLNHSVESNNRKMEANLYFKRGDQNEMYFFNKYDAKLTKADGAELEQTFYMDKGRGVTLKEAVNLLDGRAVNKDLVNSQGQEYNAWVKLDFENKNDKGNYERKMYHENFGYDLEKALEKHSVKELSDPTEREKLIASLKKGNLQAATEQSGERIFIAAEPESGKANKVALYDKNGKEITVEMRNVKQSQGKNEDLKNDKQQESTTGKANEQKKGSKKQSGEEDDLLPKADKKKARGKRKDGENELMPKNREGTGKGVKI